MLPRLSLKGIVPSLPPYILDEHQQEKFLSLYPVKDCRPHIVEFSPWSGVSSSLIVIIGHGFRPRRELNQVTVGGTKALVVTAERHRLVVICSSQVKSGPVRVKTHDGEGTGPRDFKVLSWPPPFPEVDGPPYSFEGVGDFTAVDTRLFGGRQAVNSLTTLSDPNVPSKGTVKILCVAGYPRDFPPANPVTALNDVKTKVASVNTYYKQASYSQLDVAFEVIGFLKMANKRDRYFKTGPFAQGYPNIVALPQVWAECLDYAIKQGRDPNAYDIFMVILNLEVFVRGRAEFVPLNVTFNQPAATDQDALSVNITLKKVLGSMALGDEATSGRIAHEVGHHLVTEGAVLVEDIYSAGNPVTDATATQFDLMGDNLQSLFSGHNMNGVGWFSGDNVRVFPWTTSPFSQEVEIVAHGLTQNTDPNRCHLVRIDVSSGLKYYIEVRQTGVTGQVFDTTLLVAAGHDGGVLVSRAITGTLNNNEFVSLITLLQASSTTLITGEVAVDPLRTIRIIVADDNVQANPLVCKVRIEWSQPASPPGDTLDLWISPMVANCTSPDIWIDRPPYYPSEPYDRRDPQGNPINGGDAPRVGDINLFTARIHNSGTANADNVITSFYVNTPPGIGDSGNWTTLKTVSVKVPAGKDTVTSVDWNPQFGEHTCLQVAIVPQPGEISVANNKAQENVFTFAPPSHSVPEPVELPVAIRNPLNERTLIWICIRDVPAGIYVYFPRRWLYLEARAEQTLELLVIPLREIKDLKAKIANVLVQGYLPWSYSMPERINTLPPPSIVRLIGGIQATVAPKVGSKITLQREPVVGKNIVTVHGSVTPATDGQNVRVDMTLVDTMQAVYRSVKSNARGDFDATFTFSREVATVVEVAFQAHIINATVLAPADSNIVHLNVKVVPSEPEPPA